MNRAHNAQEADFAIKAVQDAGYHNITIDLIYGTPGLTDKNWLYNLAQVKKLAIPHLSAYALTVEENTALHHNIKTRKSAPVDAAQSAHQFEMLMDKAGEMGFEHYEISNFAQPGHIALHNTNYWLGVHYLGIGPSAHSFNGHSRQWNIANNALYTKAILTEKRLDTEVEILTAEQQLNE
jgi:oxygen-independent coproporphyrinogen-3 oxidase